MKHRATKERRFQRQKFVYEHAPVISELIDRGNKREQYRFVDTVVRTGLGYSQTTATQDIWYNMMMTYRSEAVQQMLKSNPIHMTIIDRLKKQGHTFEVVSWLPCEKIIDNGNGHIVKTGQKKHYVVTGKHIIISSSLYNTLMKRDDGEKVTVNFFL